MPTTASFRPPRFARALLMMAAPPSARADVLADHDAEFARLRATGGVASARRGYRRHVRRSLAPLLAMRLRHAAHAVVAPGWRDDAVQAARALARRPRVAIVCVVILTVALSAALSATSLIERAVLHPLPFPEASRIVRLWNVGPDLPAGVRSTSLLDVDDWRAASRSLAAVSAYVAHAATLAGRGEPRRLDAMRVGRDFDRVLNVRPAHGRLFAPGDFVDGSHRAAVLTHAFWLREFGGDANAVGQTLTLDEEVFRIVGVLEPFGISYPAPKYDVWLPLVARPSAFWERARETGWVTAVGRLAPSATVNEARQELTAIAQSLARQYPASNRRRAGIELDRLEDALSDTSRPVLLLIAAAIASVLIVAMGNLINLLLAQGERRRREFAVRLALGAHDARLRRQVVLESLLLAGTAGVLALSVAPAMTRLFRALYPSELPGASAAWLTPLPAAAAVLGVIVCTAMLAWPQWRLTRAASRSAAAAGSQRVTSGQARTRAALIAGQSALSVLLVALALVFVRTLSGLTATHPGFDPEGVLTFSITPTASKYATADAAGLFFDQTLEAVQHVPGVTSAGFGIGVPFVSQGWSFSVTRPGEASPTLVAVNAVSSQYPQTLRIPLLSGRLLSDDEQRGDGQVLINDAAARLLPGSGPAVGQRVSYSGRQWEVVGVIGSVRDRRLDASETAWLILPWKQAGRRPQTMVVRTTGDPLTMVAAVAAAIHAIDPSVPLSGLARLSDLVDESVAAQRFRALVVSALALVAALLAAIGVYGVTAFMVACQERENGVRLALGEPAAALSQRVVLSAVTPAAIGAAAGLGGAWIAARWVQALLFNVDARDPWTLAAAATAIVATAAIAALPPARRAARIDPTMALRAE